MRGLLYPKTRMKGVTLPNVTVLTQPGCNPCENVKRYMKMRKIDFNEVNVREDAEAAKLASDLGYLGTPVIVVKDSDGTIVDHWYDFRIDRMKDLTT